MQVSARAVLKRRAAPRRVALRSSTSCSLPRQGKKTLRPRALAAAPSRTATLTVDVMPTVLGRSNWHGLARELLQNHDADATVADYDGMTPLMEAVPAWLSAPKGEGIALWRRCQPGFPRKGRGSRLWFCNPSD